MSDRTRPSTGTRSADRLDAGKDHGADREPTPAEEQLAERAASEADPEAAEHYEEMIRRGAAQRGEGRLP